MKKVFVLTIVIMLCSIYKCYSQSGWLQDYLNTNKMLSDIYMFNDIGYILADSIMFKTTDIGEHWIGIETGVYLWFAGYNRGFFRDRDLGVLLGSENPSPASIYKLTSNGGVTFENTNHQMPSTGGFVSISTAFPINPEIIIAAGQEFDVFPTWYDGVIYKSTDGGQMWANVYRLPGSTSGVIGIKFKDDDNGFAITSSSIHQTTDGGNNWFLKSDFVNSFHSSGAYMSDSFDDTIYAAGNYVTTGGFYFRYIRSTDDGNTWSLIFQSENNARIRGAFFLNSQTAWVVGDLGLILYTSNGGANWVQQISGTTETLYSVSFINSDTGFVVGDNGVLLKTYTGGLTNINQVSNTVPDLFNLYQNYPNPFNPITNIKFDIKNFGNVTVQIFDALGRQIATVLDESLSPGTYSVYFDGSNLASGVYFYKIKAGSFEQTRRMLMIK